MFILGIVFFCVPLIYGIFFKKKKLLAVFTALIITVAIVLSNVLGNTLYSLNISTSDIFSSAEAIDSFDGNISECGIDYKQFITKSDKKLKNIIIAASDQRPDNKSETYNFRTDIIILISIEVDTRNMYLFTLPRDTPVRYTVDYTGSRSVCILGETVAKTGSVQGLVNAIRMNYGLDIDEYMIVTWVNFVNICRSLFDDSIPVPLTEIELLGINQTLPNQNQRFGFDRKSCLFTEYDSDEPFGKAELEYIDSIDKNEELHNINKLLDESGESSFTRRFDEKTELVYNLNSYQLLAYVRNLNPYDSHDFQRQRNTLTLISQMIPVVLSKINDEETIKKFSSLTKESGGIYTTYSDLNELVTDLLIPVKSIHIGKNFKGDNVTQIPYEIYNYAETIDYSFEDLKTQTKKLIFDKE